MKKLYTLYILVITQGLSLIGSRMSGIAVGIWLFQTKGSTTYLLLIPFFNEITAVLFGGIAGYAVDKWRRKYAMVFGDLGQAIGTVILLLSVIGNNFNIYSIYIAVAFQGIFSLFESIAADAATTMLVTDSHRDRVNVIKEMVFPLAGIVAPVLSGLIYIAIGIYGVLLIDLITFIIAAAVLFFLDIPDPEASQALSKDKVSFFKEMILGFKYLIRYKGLFGLTIYITLINFMLNGPLELVIPYITKITGNTLLVSTLLGVMNLGAFAGAAVMTFWRTAYHRVNRIITGIGISGIMFVLFGIARVPLTLGVSLFFLMLPLPITSALFKSVIQLKTPPSIQGRAFSAISQLSNMVVPFSFLLTGFLVDKILESAVGGPKWIYVEQLFGNHPGSGIGLLLSCTGIIILSLTITIYNMPGIREMETRMPDCKAYEEHPDVDVV